MLDADSGSVYNLNLAASYLDKCNKDHERCCISDSPLPTRVLDLGDGESVKVVERGAELGKYACLSYCVRWRIVMLDLPYKSPVSN